MIPAKGCVCAWGGVRVCFGVCVIAHRRRKQRKERMRGVKEGETRRTEKGKGYVCVCVGEAVAGPALYICLDPLHSTLVGVF